MGTGRWLKGAVRAFGGTELFSVGAISASFDDFLPRIVVFGLIDGLYAIINDDFSLINGIYESAYADFDLTNGVC